MGGGANFKIPDYKQYKVTGIKELEWVQESLALKGLKDPWIRNEVWRYNQWPGWGKSARITVFRGFRIAFAAMIVTVAADQLFGSKGHDDHH